MIKHMKGNNKQQKWRETKKKWIKQLFLSTFLLIEHVRNEWKKNG